MWLEDVLNQSIEKTLAIINEKNPDLENKEEVARQVGVGAIVFNDLYTNRIKDVVFSWEEALNFDGETGPYVQYTHARACSLLRKAAEVYGDPADLAADGSGAGAAQGFDGELLAGAEAQQVAKEIYAFPERVVAAMEKLGAVDHQPPSRRSGAKLQPLSIMSARSSSMTTTPAGAARPRAGDDRDPARRTEADRPCRPGKDLQLLRNPAILEPNRPKEVWFRYG